MSWETLLSKNGLFQIYWTLNNNKNCNFFWGKCQKRNPVFSTSQCFPQRLPGFYDILWESKSHQLKRGRKFLRDCCLSYFLWLLSCIVFKTCQILASHEILAQKGSEKTFNIFITNLAPLNILKNWIVLLVSLFIGEGEGCFFPTKNEILHG